MTAVALAVFGVHGLGQPLNGALVGLGARYDGPLTTAPDYRMVLLGGVPPRPGVVHVGPGGAPLVGERWTLGSAGLGRLVASLAPPQAIGPVRLADGSTVPGFLCSAAGAADAPDITAHGSWVAYLGGERDGGLSRLAEA